MKRDIKVYKYGIFTRSIEKGICLIDKLTEDMNVLLKRRTRDSYYVECKDSVYQILSFSNSSRGYKMHYAYIDRHLLDSNEAYEVVECVIKPCLTPSYYMYNENREHSWDNHLIYFE